MKKRISWTLAITLFVPLAASAQMTPVPTESMGGYVKSPEQKAMEHYGRGLKAKKKADEADEPAKRNKLLLKAKEEFSKSVGYTPNYDGYLALGQVYMLLGMAESSYDACSHAAALKPKSEDAQGCMGEAKTKMAAGGKAVEEGGR
jgi:cytochrome c-type biogenesis protein CcmH/NrfG